MNPLHRQLAQLIAPDRVKTKAIERYAYAGDAGFYYLVPRAIVQPKTISEIIALFQFSQQQKIPLVFRAAGTSLSGQSITDGILVDISKHWKTAKVENNGETIRLQPAVIGQMANLLLKKYKRKIGPDPASIHAAMIGGILSNNSSGMCCGVLQNSYHTLKYLKFVLPNGLIFNTEDKNDYSRFETEANTIFEGIKNLRNKIANNQELFEKIRKKYKTKNTVGYGLNAFIDYEHPLDILAHLLIGAEGTLAFIAEAVMHTVSDYPFKTTAMLYFPDIIDACRAIVPLKNSNAEALELFDFRALKSIEHLKGAPSIIAHLPNGAAALLCEYQADTAEELQKKFDDAQTFLTTCNTLYPPEFTEDSYQQAILWKLRKGLYPSVAAARQKGTSVVLEDVAFPVEQLGEAIADLQKLLTQFGYPDTNIIGHAKDGNLHFVINKDFSSPAEIANYDLFMQDLVVLVVKKYDGALKGEHGTGRNVAPFVEAEWGGEAYAIMRELKQLLDNQGLLNPDVIINADEKAHLKNLKDLPTVEEEVDKCVECGFCENRCPSRNLTLTPRQRIALRRTLKRLKNDGETALHDEILKDYQYSALDTCAVDGLCATDCPVDINTGELVKRLRRENHSTLAKKLALRVAQHFANVEKAVVFSLSTGNLANGVLGKKFMPRLTQFSKMLFPAFPLWKNTLAKPPTIRSVEPQKADFVYFPACLSRMMGGLADSKMPNVVDVFLSVAERADLRVKLPKNIKGTCCGQAFSSKGFADAQQFMANETIEKLFEWTNKGKIPVVLDLTSCTYSLQQTKPFLTTENKLKFEALTILDSLDFLADNVLPKLTILHKKEKIALHPVCSLSKMNLYEKMLKIANACAETVFVPLQTGCCGMAGDRGFFFPELTASAGAEEAKEICEQGIEACYSSARSCEMSMTESTQKLYLSMLHLVWETSQ